MSERFWERVPLAQMSTPQWESLCDGCGRCCLQKLEDEDSGKLLITSVACRLLDTGTGRCSNYSRRFAEVHDCLAVWPLTAEKLRWLPTSCAYRRLAEGRALADWHPLISGDANSVKTAGISVAGRCVSEREVPLSDYERHVIHWS